MWQALQEVSTIQHKKIVAPLACAGGNVGNPPAITSSNWIQILDEGAGRGPALAPETRTFHHIQRGMCIVVNAQRQRICKIEGTVS